MPSSSEAQRRTMQAAKHDPKFAKKMAIPPDVAADFVAADQGRAPKRGQFNLPKSKKKGRLNPMPFNGSGVFIRLRNWVADAAAGVKIRADYHDAEDDGFAAGLSNAITKDGQTTVTQNIPFNGKRITNLADPVNPQDAVTKQWTSSELTKIGVSIGDTPPTSPAPAHGQLWFESDTGDTFVYYIDAGGAPGQWVQQNDVAPSTSIVDLRRNRIVNPAMQISQENGDTTGLVGAAGSYYPADQWFNYTVGFNMTGVGRSYGSALSGSRHVFTQSSSTAKPSLAANDLWQFCQNIEGNRIRDFQYGTASAKQCIFRFSIMTTNAPGTYTAFLSNNGPRLYAAPFTTAAANVWKEITLVVPGDTGGTWVTDMSLGMQLGLVFAGGSTYTGAAAGWSSNRSITGSTNAAATSQAVFHITDVGLYLDANNSGVAPRWEAPDEAQELAACQRYWSRQYCNAIVANAGGYDINNVYLPQRMRTTPAVSNELGGVATGGASIIGDFVLGPEGGYFQITATTATGNITNRLNKYNARM